MGIEEQYLIDRPSIIEEFLHLIPLTEDELEDYYLQQIREVPGG